MVISSHGNPDPLLEANPDPLPEAEVGHAPAGEVPNSEEIREGSVTLFNNESSQRTLKWPHTVLMEKQVDPGSPSAVAISRCGKLVAVGYEDSVIRLWNSEYENPLLRLHQHSESVLCIAFSPDLKILASGSSDTDVLFWNIESGTIARRLFAHSTGVWYLAFSPDGRILVTASTDMSLKFWRVQDLMRGDECPFAEPSQNSVVQSVVFSPDSSTMISFTGQLTNMWDVGTGTLTKEIQDILSLLDVSHRGDLAAAGSGDCSVRILSTQTGDELVTIRHNRSGILSARFSPDDTFVVAGSYDKTISVHYTSTGECYRSLPEYSSTVHAVAYSPIGNLVASGHSNGTVVLWNAETEKRIAEMRGHMGRVTSIDFLPDQDHLISSSNDGTVRIWSSIDVLRICES